MRTNLIFILFCLVALCSTTVTRAQVSIGNGTTVSQALPVEPFYGFTYSQSVYLASEINATGNITGVSYTAAPGTVITNTSDWVVYIGATSRTSFASTTDWEPIASLTQVFAGTATLTGGVVTITFSSPFAYNGTDNLIIAVEDNQTGFDGSGDDFYCTTVTGSRSITYRDDTNNPDPATPPTATGTVSAIPNITLLGLTQACPDPSALSSSNVTATSADLAWTENGSATDWIVEYGPTGFTPGTGTSVLTTTNPHALSGLMAATDYDFYVQSVCAPGDSSSQIGPLAFSTPCAVVTPTYTEDFTTYLDPCWSEAKGRLGLASSLNGTTSNWGADGFGNVGTTGSARMNIFFTNREEWLISPSIDLGAGVTTYELAFDVILTDFTGTGTDSMGVDDTLAVVISTDNGATWSTTNILQVWENGNQPSNTGDAIRIDLTGYTGVVKFGFYAASSVSNTDYNVYIDNFIVRVPPTCAEPSALTSTNITSMSADLGWTENGTALQWAVEYGPTGFTPGTGTTTIAVTNPAAVTGLMSATDYDFYVRAICGAGDTSSYPIAAGSFTTLCGPLMAPWTETFTGTTIPNCWMDSGQDPFNYSTGAGFGASSALDYTTAGGTNYAWIDGSTPNNAPDTLMTPLVDASSLTTPHLCLALFSNNTTSAGNNTIMIQVNDGAAWNTVATFQQNLGPNWAELSYDLSSLTITGPIQARFIVDMNSTTSTFHNDILIDDVSINNGGCAQSCIVPAQLTATNITATAADLGWMSMGTSFEVEYDTAGFTPGTGMTMVTGSNPLSLATLMSATNYEFYVRNICGAGDTSIVAGPFAFTTLANCPAPSALATTNVTATSADLGWTENGTATSWEVEYGAAGFTPGAGMSMITGSNPLSLTTLMAATDYDFYVRAICGAGDSSTWTGPTSFSTPCAVITPAYNTNFATFLPTCWDEATNGSIATGPTGLGTGSWQAIGTGTSAIVNLFTTSFSDWLVSPEFDLSAGNWELALNTNAGDYVSSGVPSATFSGMGSDDSVQVAISTDGGATWTSIYAWDATNNPLLATANEITIDLSTYTGNAIFGILATDGTVNDPEDYYVILNNFEIRMPVPPCVAPSALTATNITTTSADLGWTENGTATSWAVEYGPTGFTPGTGMNMVTATNPLNVIGLTDSTTYDYYVRAICGAGDSSTWTGPASFTTQTLTVAAPAPNLVITEIMYNPPESGADTLEFIEIYNAEATPVDLTGYSLLGVTHTFASGIIAPNSYYTVAVNGPAFNTVFGMMPDAVWTGGGLGNGGEALAIYDNNGQLVDSVRYDDSGVWPTSPDGSGPSLVFCDTALDNNDGANWSASTTATGVMIAGNMVMASPGAADGACAPVANPFEDVAPSGYFGLDSAYCGANAVITGSLIVTNNTAVTANGVNYAINVNGNPTPAAGVIATLAGNASDTINLGTLPLPVGVYVVEAITSYANDSLTSNDTISTTVVVSDPSVSIASSTDVSCNGLTDGTATAAVAGGTPGFGYLWSDNSTNATLANVGAGTYTVTVTDTVGCTATTNVTIVEPTAITTSVSPSDVLCNGGTGGAISVTATGGTGSFTYVWSNAGTANAITNIPAGTYNVSVTDANGCMVADSGIVAEPTALVATATQDGMGNATAIGTGGTAPYTFAWDDANTQTTATATGLSNGIVTATITDANGCTDTASTNVVIVGVESIANLSGLNLYPNPTSSNAFLQLDLVETADVTIQVTTVTGQSVLTKVVGAMQSEQIELPTATMPTGVYLVQINIGSEQVTRKLIISRN